MKIAQLAYSYLLQSCLVDGQVLASWVRGYAVRKRLSVSHMFPVTLVQPS